MRLEFVIDGDKQISADLLFKRNRYQNFRTPLQQSADLLQKTFQVNFQGRGSLFGKWPKREGTYSWPQLEKTGRMRRSFTDRVTPNEAVLWNSAPYFIFHQRGTKYLPKRVMMMIDEERANRIFKIFQEYVYK